VDVKSSKIAGKRTEAKNPNAFLTKESTERIAEQFGLFD